MSKNQFERLYQPIHDDLTAIRANIAHILKDSHADLDEIQHHMFVRWGKMLRPALVLFSGLAASSVAPQTDHSQGPIRSDDDAGDSTTRDHLRRLAEVMELLHTASLIHDDVLDGDGERRSLPTLNARFSDRIAVLAGDVLFSKAFGILARNFPPEISAPITDVTSAMCGGEIFAALRSDRRLTLDEYYELISMKTARFTSVCCLTGALCVGNTDTSSALARYGMEFGLAYQIVDDYVDGDSSFIKGLDVSVADVHASRAKEALQDLPSTPEMSRLADFVDTILDAVRAGAATENVS